MRSGGLPIRRRVLEGVRRRLGEDPPSLGLVFWAEAAIAVARPERYRIWRMYMAGMAHAFERGWRSVVQVVAYKPSPSGPTSRPWTRDHQYALDSAVPRARQVAGEVE